MEPQTYSRRPFRGANCPPTIANYPIGYARWQARAVIYIFCTARTRKSTMVFGAFLPSNCRRRHSARGGGLRGAGNCGEKEVAHEPK